MSVVHGLGRALAFLAGELFFWLVLPAAAVIVVLAFSSRALFFIVLLVIAFALFVLLLTTTLGTVRARQAALEREVREAETSSHR